MSHERSDIAGAEGLYSFEGNICGTAIRGTDALLGSKATSPAKALHRKLGEPQMGADEEGTLAAPKALRREIVDPAITDQRGRLVKTTGDGIITQTRLT